MQAISLHSQIGHFTFLIKLQSLKCEAEIAAGNISLICSLEHANLVAWQPADLHITVFTASILAVEELVCLMTIQKQLR